MEPGVGCRLIIAIDGPGGAGKTSVGREVARRLGYSFLDTGMLYRALTWLAICKGIGLYDGPRLASLARSVEMELRPAPPEAMEPSILIVNGEDVTGALRRRDVEEGVSIVSQVAEVREALIGLQRRIAAQGGVVVAGRDIGTVILPNAHVKVYLDASLEERARRRQRQLQEMGQKVSLDEVMAQLRARDRLDSQREVAPLRPASDAVIIYTDGMSLEQVIEKVISLVEERCS